MLLPQPLEPQVDARVSEDFLDSAVFVLEALDEGNDELAESILLRMSARGPDPGTAAWIHEVGRVLEGRAVLRQLDLRLVTVVEELDGTKTKRLVLRVNAGGESAVSLHMTPPILAWERDWIDASGNGGRSSDEVGLNSLERLDFAPQSLTDIPVLDLPPARGQALAMRERWSLEMHFCYLEVEGTRYPTNAPFVQPLERYLLATHLQLGPVHPGACADLLAERPDANLQAIIERAVRVLPEHHDESLDLLTPVVLDMTLLDVQRAVPALSWLTGEARARGEYHGSAGDLTYFLSPEEDRPLMFDGQLLDPVLLHGNPLGWQRWLVARDVIRARKPASPLDLPTSVGDAAAPR